MFEHVIGQSEAQERLMQMVGVGRLPHAIMLCGPSGSGKLALAMDFAAQLLGRTQNDKAMLQLRIGHRANRICFSVVDLSGRELLHQTYSHATEAQLSLSALPAGEYICRGNADGFVVTRKIIKL